jgi:hypothetical protein
LRHEIENRLIEQRSKNEEAAEFLIFTLFERKSKRLRKSYAAVYAAFYSREIGTKMGFVDWSEAERK